MKKRILISVALIGTLFLAGCLFWQAPLGSLSFVADQLIGPPSLDDGGFKVTFDTAGGTGEYVIDFGDGTTGVPSSPLAHVYERVGFYTAVCTSGDETARLEIVVENAPCGELYAPFICSPVTDCQTESWGPPWHPCVECGPCPEPEEVECDLWECERAILDGTEQTIGSVHYGAEDCCGYDLTYEWRVVLRSSCYALESTWDLEAWGEGPVVAWYIGNDNPPLDPDYPVITAEGSFGPLGCPGPLPEPVEDHRVALATITLTVIDQFGSWQSISVEKWVCSCSGCEESPCP
jgi:hypothetical protein